MGNNNQDDIAKLVGSMKSLASPFRAYLQELHARYKPVRDGKVADYIPELAKADPDGFRISVVTVDNQVFEVGDYETLFTIQSISKAFVYGMALEDHGRERTLSKVGVEPTGDAFNSLIKLDEHSHRPHNPMVNAERDRDRGPDRGRGCDRAAASRAGRVPALRGAGNLRGHGCVSVREDYWAS